MVLTIFGKVVYPMLKNTQSLQLPEEMKTTNTPYSRL